MNIGERIKNLRKERGLSVDFVAEKLNKNRATIYRYESNEIENLPISILEPLAKLLGTTPAYLIGCEEKTDIKVSQDEKHLIEIYEKLNDIGKREATKRIEELTHIPIYSNAENQEYNFAAHDDGLDKNLKKKNTEKAKAIFKEMDNE